MYKSHWIKTHPILGSFFAGQAGRSEIIAHGSTINPEYYRDLACYPLTPSLGCLTALETWSEVDGSLLRSDQLRLIQQIKQHKINKGLLIVVPVPGIKHNLKIRDVEALFFD